MKLKSFKYCKYAMKNLRKRSPSFPPSLTRIFEQRCHLNVAFSEYLPCNVLVASANERTLQFPVKLLVGKQIIKTTVLVDSSATGNFIDLRLLSLINFPLKKLPQPIQAFIVDGTANRRRTILWKVHTCMVLPHNSKDIDLMVVSLGRKQIILGMSWLKSRNPHIDWRNNTLSFTNSPASSNANNLTP